MSLIFQMFISNMITDYVFFEVENKLRNTNPKSPLYNLGRLSAASLMTSLTFEDCYLIKDLLNWSKRR